MKYLGIILGILALAINSLFASFPLVTETLYYRVVFQVVRILYDHTLGWSPIPMVYLLFLFLVWLIARILDVAWGHITADKSLFQRIIDTLLSLLNPVGYILFAFYFLWGWNYQKTSFEDRMGFQSVKADTAYLQGRARSVMAELLLERAVIKDSTAYFIKSDIPNNLESDLRKHQEAIISSWGEPVLGRVRVRELQPSGLLLRISTAGVYIPFVSEGHIDAGLHPLQYPFTMAHEMAHGYGYTDEGVCNFVGYVTCLSSDDPMIRYAGKLGYWRYLLSNLRSEAVYSYEQIRNAMPEPIRMDLKDIADQMDLYPDIFPDIRNAIYDSYLKSHGVKKGIANYNDIVRLVAQYEQKKQSLIQ